MTSLIAVGQTVRLYVWRIAGKTGLVVSSVSKSPKVIGTDTDRSRTHNFPINVPWKPWTILYRFQDIARYWPKTASFSEPTFI